MSRQTLRAFLSTWPRTKNQAIHRGMIFDALEGNDTVTELDMDLASYRLVNERDVRRRENYLPRQLTIVNLGHDTEPNSEDLGMWMFD